MAVKLPADKKMFSGFPDVFLADPINSSEVNSQCAPEYLRS